MRAFSDATHPTMWSGLEIRFGKFEGYLNGAVQPRPRHSPEFKIENRSQSALRTLEPRIKARPHDLVFQLTSKAASSIEN